MIRGGVWEYPPYWYISSDNTLDGLLGPFATAITSSILGSAIYNITYIPSESHITAACFDNGTCINGLRDLQIGKIDFVVPISYQALMSVGINLTTASVSNSDSCYLGYKKELKVNVNYSAFFNFLSDYGTWFWLLLLSLSGVFILIFILFEKYHNPSMAILNFFWYQFEYTIAQNNHWAHSNRLINIFLPVTLLLIGKLFSGSLQTGLVSHLDYLKLNTFEDVLRYKYQPFIQETCSCISEFRNNPHPITRAIASKLIIFKINNQTATENYKFSRQNRMVEINYKPLFRIAKSMGCIISRKREEREPYETSIRPVFSTLSGILINKFNRPEISQIIFKRSYRAFQSGLVHNRVTNSIRLKCLGLDQAPSSCVENTSETSTKIVPITLEYLRLPLLFLIYGLTIITLIMIIEYYYSKKLTLIIIF